MSTALITGASQGIGRAIAEHLAELGWRVIAVSRRAPAIPFTSRNVNHRRADLANESSVLQFFGTVRQDGTRLRAIVNNAAIQGGNSIREQSFAEWQAMLDVNLSGPWLVVKHALPLLESGASIVNVGSVAAVAGFPDRAAYCASKHGLLGLTRALAVELAPLGVRVNHLCLGSFDTPGLSQLAESGGRTVEDYASRQVLGRLGRPEEAAQACAFLISDEAGFVTGASLSVDGGMLVRGA